MISWNNPKTLFQTMPIWLTTHTYSIHPSIHIYILMWGLHGQDIGGLHNTITRPWSQFRTECFISVLQSVEHKIWQVKYHELVQVMSIWLKQRAHVQHKCLTIIKNHFAQVVLQEIVEFLLIIHDRRVYHTHTHMHTHISILNKLLIYGMKFHKSNNICQKWRR